MAKPNKPHVHLVKQQSGPAKPGNSKPGRAPQMTNGQRALWTFLMCTLVGPFLVGVVVLLITLTAGALQIGPPSLKGVPMAAVAAKAGQWALTSFVWSALPAGLAGAVLAAVVSLQGTFHWLVAAAAAVAGFGVAAVVAPGLLPNHHTFVAAIAGLVGVGCWHLLVRTGIVPR
jgi:hypothetical protein